MKTKKSKKANLENYRTLFFQIGLILALSVILVAFEWKSEVELKRIVLTTPGVETIELDMPITKPEAEIEKVEPPSFELKIVDDFNEDVIDDLSHLISEIDEFEEIKIIEFKKDDEVVVEDFIKIEIKPTFKGKDAKYFRNYIASNLKFPISAIESGVTGKVKASFIIDTDGSVSDIVITRGVHPVIDKAVIEAIKSSPKWEPGIQEGRYVKVRFSIAIAFDLI